MDIEKEFDFISTTPAKIAFDLRTPSYDSHFLALNKDLLFFHRHDHPENGRTETEIFGRFWALVYLPNEAKLFTTRKNEVVKLEGPMGIWIPPYSILEWYKYPSEMLWRSYLSRAPVPSHLPNDPIAFSWSPEQMPETAEEIFELVNNQQSGTEIGKEEFGCGTAIRVKKHIDLHFNEELTVKQIATDLGLSHSVMTRLFKSCFGIPPIEYRNRLRIFEAQSLLLFTNKNVMTVSVDVGYADLSRFNKNFRRILGTVPSELRKQSAVLIDQGSAI